MKRDPIYKSRDIEKQRLFSLLAYHEQLTTYKFIEAYEKEYGKVKHKHLGKLITELADAGDIQQIKRGLYRRVV